jgi:Family of unknown function (DUF5319)
MEPPTRTPQKQERPPPSGDGLLSSTLPPQRLPGGHGTRTVGHVPHEPLDPFAGDPADPAAHLPLPMEDDDDEPPLSAQEREELITDLADLEGFRALLEPRDVLGIVIECEDCGERHYMDWDLVVGNLRSLLTIGRTRVHEPAYSPDPTRYVSWEYARGYSDGVLEAADDAAEADEDVGRDF